MYMLQLFYFDVAKVDQGMLHMLQVFQMHVTSVCSDCFICFSDVCCKRFDLDVAYVFTHMLQVYILDVSSVSDVCCIQVFHVARVSCGLESQGARGSDGGRARVPENGPWRADDRQMWRVARGGLAVWDKKRRGAPAGRGERMGAGNQGRWADCKRVSYKHTTTAMHMRAWRISGWSAGCACAGRKQPSKGILSLQHVPIKTERRK